MSRTLAEIQASMDDAQAAETSLSGLNSPSQTAIYKLWKYIVSLLSFLNEQNIDSKITAIETEIDNAPVGSEPWLRAKVFEFQYDAVVPQVLTLVNFAPAYNPIDVSKRIVTRAAIITGANNTVYVKFAVSDPPVAASAPQLTAMQAYLTDGGDGTFAGRGVGLGFAGVTYLAQSFNADKLYLAGTIYYNAQYSSTILADVIAAINLYLANIPYNGTISLLGITDAIQSLSAVNDVFLSDVAIRSDVTPFANKTFLRQNNTDLIPTSGTFAGYVVEETTPLNTFTDKLILTAS